MLDVVVTGVGLVTPQGCTPGAVLERLRRRDSAVRPAPFAPPICCPVFAPVIGFDPAEHFPDNKNLRLMNRDAHLAVVAARQAMHDAGLSTDRPYPPEEIALMGSTGLSGLPVEDIVRLVENAAAPDGSLDLKRFGQAALRRIRPVLSFKILANMPICFVSIFEDICGPNAVYTPWQGQGAQALAAGICAVAGGEVPCALVGGCDVKTHVLSVISLQQLGVLDSWRRHGSGPVPGEGAAFLVLEERRQAIRRGARILARLAAQAFGSTAPDMPLDETLHEVLRPIAPARPGLLIGAGDGDVSVAEAERQAIGRLNLGNIEALYPRAFLGDLFAAAPAVQVALAAEAARTNQTGQVQAHCFGYGSEQAAFVLEAA
jgi:3-oxoacyl-[acyl-carrier-protein] synthase II